MKSGHLFNGIGGFALAAHWMGWENIMHCEIDPFCNQVMKHHFPKSILHEDIRTTDFSIWRGRINLLTGGFPCQPYSSAGKRKGTADNRHLWPEMLRAIREIQPTWIVPENVRGLINWSKGMVFEQVQAEMEAEGYEVIPFLIPACGINAPHERYRVWFVAHSNRVTSSISIPQWGQDKASYTYTSGKNEIGIIADPYSGQRSQRWLHTAQSKEAERHISTFNSRYDRQTWQDFPTQFPICNGNDGLSDRLADITVPSKKYGTRILTGKQAYGRWRKESIKSLGNAIVPQVAFEIFKAIDQYQKLL